MAYSYYLIGAVFALSAIDISGAFPINPPQPYKSHLEEALYEMRIQKNEALEKYRFALPETGNWTLTASGHCSTSKQTVSCKNMETTINGRWVGYQVPKGTAPSDGWPFVVIFHGWMLFNSQWAWYAGKSYANGLFHKASTIDQLLAAGFGVITPDAISSKQYWETNDAAYATSDLSKWTRSADCALVKAIVSGCESGTFGACNAADLHAAGFSSGAYMTGRMGVSHAATFRSLSVVAGAYYYCSGSCTDAIADALPSSVWKAHPPTLFLHGTRDGTVPESTSTMYYNRLLGVGVATKKVTEKVDHQWLTASPAQIVAWVQKHSSTVRSSED